MRFKIKFRRGYSCINKGDTVKFSKKGVFSPSDWLELVIVVGAMIISILLIVFISSMKTSQSEGITSLNSTSYFAQKHLTTYSQLTSIHYNKHITNAELLSDLTYKNIFEMDTITKEIILNSAQKYFSQIPNSRVTLVIKSLKLDINEYIYGIEDFRKCSELSKISLSSNEETESRIELIYEYCEVIPSNKKKIPTGLK